MNSIDHASWPAMSGRQLWEVGPGKCKMGCSRAVATGTATEVDGSWCRLGIAKHSRRVKTDSWKERVQIPGDIIKGDGHVFACNVVMLRMAQLLSYEKHTYREEVAPLLLERDCCEGMVIPYAKPPHPPRAFPLILKPTTTSTTVSQHCEKKDSRSQAEIFLLPSEIYHMSHTHSYIHRYT